MPINHASASTVEDVLEAVLGRSQLEALTTTTTLLTAGLLTSEGTAASSPEKTTQSSLTPLPARDRGEGPGQRSTVVMRSERWLHESGGAEEVLVVLKLNISQPMPSSTYSSVIISCSCKCLNKT